MNNLVLSLAPKVTGDRSVFAVARGCLKLTKLNICGCSDFSDHYGIEFLSSYCRKLKILNLGWCEGVGDAGLMSLPFGVLISMLLTCVTVSLQQWFYMMFINEKVVLELQNLLHLMILRL
ncbi:putative leucine-rich repeat domain superfamily [Helianthus annuus]|nr:putative leucine-rich repeat domain superfamily [Helianthus annuus]